MGGNDINMDDIINNFFLNGGITRGIIERKKQENNGDVLHTNINNYTIDSCYTFDEGYETAIWKGNNSIIVVERYSNIEEMQKGHKKWCEFCKTNPKKAYSVQEDIMINF